MGVHPQKYDHSWESPIETVQKSVTGSDGGKSAMLQFHDEDHLG